jgi:hypothetical protein
VLTPPVGSLSLMRWARGPLSIPYRLGTPAYRLQVKTRSRMCCHVSSSSELRLPTEEGSSAAICPSALDLASLLMRALVLPHVLWLRTSPPYRGELQCCHVSNNSGPRLPAEEGFSITTHPTAPDLDSALRGAPVLVHVPRFSMDHRPHVYRKPLLGQPFILVMRILKAHGSTAFKAGAFPRRTCMAVLQWQVRDAHT